MLWRVGDNVGLEWDGMEFESKAIASGLLIPCSHLTRPQGQFGQMDPFNAVLCSRVPDVKALGKNT